MKKRIYIFCILTLLLCANIYAQENAITISSFTAKNQLPSNIQEWNNTPGALLLVAQNNTWGDRACKLIITIKKGDAKICGNADGIALDYFKTRSFQTNDLLAGLNNCEALQPGNYTLCVLFRGLDSTRQWVTVSPEICKPFTVGGGSTSRQQYTRPSIISPENGKIFTEQDIKKPVTFRWTPVVPPVKNVTYILRVWSIEDGQTPRQAMLSGSPFIEERISNRTQYIYTGNLPDASRLRDSPYLPPAPTPGGGGIPMPARMNNDSLKSVSTTNPTPNPKREFVVTVQGVDEEGKPYGENNGMSEPSVFSVTSAGCGTNKDVVTISCKAWVNGLPTYNISIVFNNVVSTTGGQQCTTQMNSITAATGTISGLAGLPATIPSGGNSPVVIFTYTPANATQTAATFNYTGVWNDGNSNTSNFNSGLVTLPSCVCNTCNGIQWQAGTSTQTLQENAFNIIQPFNPTGISGSITTAKAEIKAFERYVGDSCMSCNKDGNLWGNFTAGTYAGLNGSLGSAATPVTGFTHHTIYFKATGPGSFNLIVSTPPLSNLSCCCDRVAVTIRYTYTFKADNGTCIYCSFVKRYQLQKGTCPKIPPTPHEIPNQDPPIN